MNPRSNPIAGRTPTKRQRDTPRRSGRARDPEWLAHVAALPCCLRDRPAVFLSDDGRCSGRIEVNHVGPRPLGRKCSDRETAPMCRRHHRDWTDHEGYFAHRAREWRRQFAAWSIAWTTEQIPERDARANSTPA